MNTTRIKKTPLNVQRISQALRGFTRYARTRRVAHSGLSIRQQGHFLVSVSWELAGGDEGLGRPERMQQVVDTLRTLGYGFQFGFGPDAVIGAEAVEGALAGTGLLVFCPAT